MQRSIGLNIKEQRNRLGLTQEELGKRTGFGVTRISDLERNRYKTPDTETLMKLGQALGCSIDDLLYGPEEEWRDEVNEWPLFEYIRSSMAEVQPYPDQERWKLVVTAYERAVTRATMLVKAIDEIAAQLGGSAEKMFDDSVADMIPERLPQHTTGTNEPSDLVRHAAAVQETPHQRGESDVPASARIDQLEAQLREQQAEIRRMQDVTRELALAAADRGQKPRAAAKKSKGRSGHRKAS